MLRIERFRFARRKAEERGIEQLDVIKNPFGFYRVVGKEADQLRTFAQTIPKLTNVPRAWETSRQAHYRNFILKLIHLFIRIHPCNPWQDFFSDRLEEVRPQRPHLFSTGHHALLRVMV